VTLFGPGKAQTELWDGTKIEINMDEPASIMRSRRGKAGPLLKDHLSLIDRGAMGSITGKDVQFEFFKTPKNIIGKGKIGGPIERTYTIAVR